MKMTRILRIASLTAGSIASCFAQGSGPDGGPIVQVVVTAEARHGKQIPIVNPNDVSVTSGKEALRIVQWVPAPPTPLQILLLIDDSLNTNIGTQMGDLKHFITGLPADAQIGVGYMRNGTVDMVQQFTTDHAAAATRIRLPMGNPGANSSPYFSLVELLKGWAPIAGRREIIMISDGIDRYGGIGPDNPYVNQAMEHAQRAGVVVSSIYWGGEGHFGHSYFRLNWGQNYLSELADATGGEAYWQGFGNPVSFAPYLEDFTARLSHQYLLTFEPKSKTKAGMEPIRIRTELPGAELVGPTQVWTQAQ